MGTLTLLLGGARSGKSTWAQRTAQVEGGDHVLFVATAQALDDEMAERIARHRAARPASWRTLEAPRHVGEAIQRVYRGEAVVVVDCLTLLVGNVLLSFPDAEVDRARRAALAEAEALVAFARSAPAHTIVVSNEVGMGIVPTTRLGRVYRDLLGEVNQRLAAAANNVYLLVAGIPLVVKGDSPGTQ